MFVGWLANVHYRSETRVSKVLLIEEKLGGRLVEVGWLAITCVFLNRLAFFLFLHVFWGEVVVKGRRWEMQLKATQWQWGFCWGRKAKGSPYSWPSLAHWGPLQKDGKHWQKMFMLTWKLGVAVWEQSFWSCPHCCSTRMPNSSNDQFGAKPKHLGKWKRQFSPWEIPHKISFSWDLTYV